MNINKIMQKHLDEFAIWLKFLADTQRRHISNGNDSHNWLPHQRASYVHVKFCKPREALGTKTS